MIDFVIDRLERVLVGLLTGIRSLLSETVVYLRSVPADTVDYVPPPSGEVTGSTRICRRDRFSPESLQFENSYRQRNPRLLAILVLE